MAAKIVKDEAPLLDRGREFHEKRPWSSTARIYNQLGSRPSLHWSGEIQLRAIRHLDLCQSVPEGFLLCYLRAAQRPVADFSGEHATFLNSLPMIRDGN
jgi:hypothetical protein